MRNRRIEMVAALLAISLTNHIRAQSCAAISLESAATVALPAGLPASSVVIGDFDGDGYGDIAVGYTGTTFQPLDGVVLFLRKSEHSFEQRGPFGIYYPFSIVTADFNRDGFADIAAAQFSNSVGVMFGTAAGALTGPQGFPVGIFPTAIITDDFNGDGIPDLASLNSFGEDVSVLLGVGDGTFAPQRRSAVPIDFPTQLSSGDFDGDGKIDIAVAGRTPSDTIFIFRGDGNGSFRPSSTVVVSGRVTRFATGDFNNDGRSDIAVLTVDPPNVSVLLASDNGTFQKQPDIVGLAPAGAIVATDFDGDGNIDLATNTGLNSVSLFRGAGNGTFALSQTVTVGSAPFAIAARKLERNRYPGLVTLNRDSHDLTVLNNSCFVVPAPTAGPIARGSLALALALAAMWFIQRSST